MTGRYIPAFSQNELVGLDPETLRGLLDLAPGGSVMDRAAYLGLKPLDSQADYDALKAAVPELGTDVQPYSPPIGAGHEGVRSSLTPAGHEPAALVDADQLPPTDLTGATGSVDLPGEIAGMLSAPDPEAASDIADVLQHSAETGDPFVGGTFAIYGDPSGAVVIVTETSAHGLRTDVIPRKAVRFALSLIAGGSKRSLISRMIFRG